MHELRNRKSLHAVVLSVGERAVRRAKIDSDRRARFRIFTQATLMLPDLEPVTGAGQFLGRQLQALPQESSEHHGVERLAALHLVPARFVGLRRGDIEQIREHFGGHGLFGKLWLLPWIPGAGRHNFPVDPLGG